jgi:hypothetical protein
VKRQRVTAPQIRLRSSGNTSSGNDSAAASKPSGKTTASDRPTTTPSGRPTTTLSGRPFVDPVPGMTAATQFAKKYKHKPWLDKPETPTPQSRSDRGPEQPSSAPDGINTAVPSDHETEYTASLPVSTFNYPQYHNKYSYINRLRANWRTSHPLKLPSIRTTSLRRAGSTPIT